MPPILAPRSERPPAAFYGLWLLVAGAGAMHLLFADLLGAQAWDWTAVPLGDAAPDAWTASRAGSYVGHVFAHAGWGHLIANLMGLAVFGAVAAQRLGRRVGAQAAFVALFFGSAVAGAVAESVAAVPEPAVLVGASTGVAGLGAATLYTLLSERVRRVWVRSIAYVCGLLAAVAADFAFAGAVQGAADGATAVFGHIGGLGLGAVVFPLLDRAGASSRRGPQRFSAPHDGRTAAGPVMMGAGRTGAGRKDTKMTVAAILKTKGAEVATARLDLSLLDAAKLLHERKIGAVVVVDAGGAISGVLSERDIIREIARRGPDAVTCTAADAMTAPVITCRAEETADAALARMTDRRIRHLPVVDAQGGLAGIVSIGDLVKRKIAQAEADAEALKSYIAG